MYILSNSLLNLLQWIYLHSIERMKIDPKKLIPYLAAIVIFAALTLIYFKPLLDGKVLRQDDIARHKGMSKEIADYREKYNKEPLWTNSMFGGMPAYQVSTLYPGNWLSKLDPAFKLWLPHPGGYLFLYFLGFYILLLCLKVDPWLSLIGALAYGLSSYFLIIIEAGHNSKANALGYLPAMIGGIVLIFNGRRWLGFAIAALFSAMQINANHVQISYYGYILIAFIITGFFVEAMRNGQLGAFFKSTAFFTAATLIALLPNAGNLLTTNEYGQYSTRGKSELTIKSNLKKKFALDDARYFEKVDASDPNQIEAYEKNTTTGLDADYATQWSYGIDETMTFLIPDFKGGASQPIASADKDALKKVNPDFREQVGQSSSYFGDQPFTSGPVYIGAIIVFLALIGSLIVKGAFKWALLLATLLTVALSWGANFMGLTDLFMHYVPGYNKFRAVSMILVVAELTLPLLAVLGLNEMIKAGTMNKSFLVLGRSLSLKKIIYGSAIVTAGFCLVGYLLPDMVNSFTSVQEENRLVQRYMSGGYPEDQIRPFVSELMPQLGVARKAVFKSDAMRSFIFIALSFMVLVLFFNNKINRNITYGALGLFVLIDLWSVDMRYLNDGSYITKEQNTQMIAGKSAADIEILKDTDPDYRVLNLESNTFNDASTSYYHKSIGGYHGAKLKKYQELIDFHLDKEISYLFKNGGMLFGSNSSRDSLLANLGVINMLNTRYLILPAGNNADPMVLKNNAACGNAWFIKHLFAVKDADEEIIGLRKLNTKDYAVIQDKALSSLAAKTDYSANGEIKLVSYKPDELVYVSNSSENQFAIFSEIYYPKGWNAYLDGKLVDHAAVNYVLRGLPIPAGKHKVEFKFEPNTYASGNQIALIGSIVLLLAVGIGVYLNGRNKVIVS